MDIEMGDGDGTPTPHSEPSLTDGNLLPSTSLSPKAQASLQSCRAETNFDSCNAYLEPHGYRDWKTGLDIWNLNEVELGSFKVPEDLGSRVLNVSKNCHVSLSARHSDLHHTNVIEALCDPPHDARLQIVLWSLSSVDHMVAQSDLLDYLAFHFSLDPQFFRAVKASIQEIDPDNPQYINDRQDWYNPTYAKIGNAIVTVCRLKDETNGIPVVLIAHHMESDHVADRGVCPSLQELEREPLHLRPPLRRSQFSDSQLASLRGLGSYRYYPQLLSCLLESQKETRDDFTNLLLICFLPCLQLQLVRIRSRCGMTRVVFEDHRKASTQAGTDSRTERSEKRLYTHRTLLRSDISDVEDQWSAVLRYMKMSLCSDPSKGLLFQDFEKEIGHVIGESNRLESQVRDYLQLRAGTLGLEESRRSIELSNRSLELTNRQIEEAKRVKIFTVLAFVYIPLNIATSVFGMNLQQLNGSGQSLVDFVLTALLALIITGWTWYAIEVFNGYRIWQEGRGQQPTGKEPSPNYSVAERIGMIVWLVRNGHGSWTRTTGAWWRISLNNSKPFGANGDSEMPAGDLVSKYSTNGQGKSLQYYKPRNQ